MANKFSIEINIPVSDYIYKYLTVKYGTEPIKTNRFTAVGSIILSMLTRNGDVRHDGKLPSGKTFKVVIKEEHYLRNGVYIDNRSVRIFNECIERLFKEELYSHVIINKNTHDSQYLDSIRNFISVYGITEDDLNLDTVYRGFRRMRDELKNRMTLQKTA